jgi:uncharacterized membrane protein (UPF0127 family)
MYKTALTVIFLALIIITACPLYSAPVEVSGKTEIQEQYFAVSSRKKGSLIFIKRARREIVKRIDIEVADSDRERNRGLMNRKSMPDSQGMLFVYKEPGPRKFWMKNTHIPLDVIFVNNKYEVVSVRKHNKPFSTNSIISREDIMYVIEVSAGFCDMYNIQEGDRVRFSYL